ncbi:MAG TPA: PadR family transcriptional regulator [Actinomycetospora sp.]|nr:PadR family transcriptional regulator [Actinomycetospora sp.]
MTAEPRPDAHDLSAAFGRPAAASLRGLLPPRPRRGGQPAGEPAPEADETDEAVEPGPRAPRGGRPGPAGPAPRAATGTARRWGTVRLSSHEHVELLVLVALRRGPGDGREIAERLRHDSGGGLAPPPTTVQRTVHHLARHGLVERDPDATRRRYRLTEPGRRAVRARVRAWQALRRAVDAVVRADDED